jgi:UV DNA damage repair endonuclease
MITLGYCCNSLGTHKTNFKTITLKKIKTLNFEPVPFDGSWRYIDDWYAHYDHMESGAKVLFNIYVHNIKELIAVLDYNIQNNIKLYRISSNLFPLWSYGQSLEFTYKNFNYWIRPCKVFNSMIKGRFDGAFNGLELQLRKTVQKYLDGGGRLTMHPPEFVSLGGSPVVQNSSRAELIAHAMFLDWIGAPADYSCPLNIHVSRGADNPAITANNVNVMLLQVLKHYPNAFKRIVFETEDKGCWTWQELIKHFPGMPITLDVHHWKINNEGEPLSEALEACHETWKTRTNYSKHIQFVIDHPSEINNANYQMSIKPVSSFDFYWWRSKAYKPLLHISKGRDHEYDRSHHDYVDEISDNLLYAPFDLDLEVEAKAKDLAYFALRDKYKELVA